MSELDDALFSLTSRFTDHMINIRKALVAQGWDSEEATDAAMAYADRVLLPTLAGAIELSMGEEHDESDNADTADTTGDSGDPATLRSDD